MKIKLDGKEYEVGPEQLETVKAGIHKDVLAEYGKVDDWIKIALKPIARWFLSKFELHLGEEAKPKKHENPSLMLIQLLLNQMQKYLDTITIEVETDGGSNISSIKTPAYQSLTGGPLGNPGGDGPRQDVLCEGVDASLEKVS